MDALQQSQKFANKNFVKQLGRCLFINDNKLYLLIRKKETNGKKY